MNIPYKILLEARKLEMNYLMRYIPERTRQEITRESMLEVIGPERKVGINFYDRRAS